MFLVKILVLTNIEKLVLLWCEDSADRNRKCVHLIVDYNQNEKRKDQYQMYLFFIIIIIDH